MATTAQARGRARRARAPGRLAPAPPAAVARRAALQRVGGRRRRRHRARSTRACTSPGSLAHLERALDQVEPAPRARAPARLHARARPTTAARPRRSSSAPGCELWMHPSHEHADARREDPEAVLARRARGRAPERRARPSRCGAGRERARGRADRHRAARRARPRRCCPASRCDTDLGAWIVVETPGHAPSHVCLFQPERRLLISGDHLLGRISLYFDYGYSPDPVGEFLRLARRRRAPRRAAVPGRPRAHVHRRARPHRGQPRARRRAPRARCCDVAARRRADHRVRRRRRASTASDRRRATRNWWLQRDALLPAPPRGRPGGPRASATTPGERRSAGAPTDRVDVARLAAMRIDELLARRRPARLLVRVLPAEDRRRASATSTPRSRELRAAASPTSCRSPTARAAARATRRSRSSRASSASTAWRRWRTSPASARPSTSCATTLDAMRDGGHRQRPRAARRPAAGPGRVDEDRGRPGVLARARRADPRRLRRSRSARRASPRRTSTRRAPRTTCATSRRRSTPACDFLITQLFFDNALLLRLRRAARATIGIDVPIIPGIMPITNVAQIERIT